MRAVVTGDAGFLGRHFRHTLDERYTVIGIDTKNGVDCRDFFAQDDGQWDLVIHCAATVGGRATIDGSPLKLATNLSLDAEFFTWAIGHAKRAVYLSSSAVYPTALQSAQARCAPLAEAAVGRSRLDEPDALYGWIKLTGERLAQLAFEAGSRVLVLRPFSGYGSDQDPAYPFRAFIERARHREDPFTVWGSGEQVRDFIHVDDVVAATLALIEAGYVGPVNLCTGIATSFNRLAHQVTKAAGYDPELKHCLDAPIGVDWRVGDPTILQRYYTPKVSLQEGIRRAIEDC